MQPSEEVKRDCLLQIMALIILSCAFCLDRGMGDTERERERPLVRGLG